MVSRSDPDRLRVIVETYFGFFEAEAGFTSAGSSYDPVRLVGDLALTREDVLLKFHLRNDDLDLYVAPAGPHPSFTDVNLLLLYFERVQVDYAEFMNRPPAPKLTQDQMWTDWAADIHRHLEAILSFAQAAGYEERVADHQRYEAQGAENLRRQLAEWNAD